MPAVWTDKNQFYSQHPAGASALMCDGSVQFIIDETDRGIIYNLSTKAGGEIASVP